MISGTVLEEIELIYQCGSFSKAAEKLGVTQPALSLKVKKLEQELDTQLFDRTADMSLTMEGKIFLEYVAKRKILDLDLQSQLADLQEKVTGVLTVGSTHGFATGYLPLCIAEFSKQYPNVKVRLIEGEMPDVEKMALEGQIDVFITALNDEHNDFTKEFLFEENIFLCVPESYRNCDSLRGKFITRDELLKRPVGSNEYERVPLTWFDKQTFVLTQKNFNIGKISRNLLEHAGINSSVKIIETNQMTTSVAMTNCGIGLSFVAEDYVRTVDYIKFPLLLKLEDADGKRKVYAAFANKRYLSHASKAFLQVMRRCNI